MTIEGAILIGARALRREPAFHAFNASTGELLPLGIAEATTEDVAEACALASNAFAEFSTLTPDARAKFIERVAEEVLNIGDELIETAVVESGLPRPRLEGERMRTVNQLRLFAYEVRKAEFFDATIDPALTDRAPPRSDLRRMNLSIGPVAVFGASNFPLAFSVAGGDTASAFAAGCPVVVKGHPAHPATGELVARAIQRAVVESGLPEGVFSYLPGRSSELGAALVSDPHIKAVGFTGSRAGGLALVDIASRRREPIPVYAEMSSINPVILFPAALGSRTEEIAAGFVSSLTLGAGQFCTNPGLVLAVEGPDLDRFVTAAAVALSQIEGSAMLSPAIQAAYDGGVAALDVKARRIASGKTSGTPNRCHGAIFEVTGAEFQSDDVFSEEVFGASALIVRCRDMDELLRIITELEGQLTATVQLDPADEQDAFPVLDIIQSKVGRVLANGWPTGVEVTWAMVHGGPFPATSDGRTTSVGTLAIARFLRPVCFQDMPDNLLPQPLKASNPWRIPRRINGEWEMA